MLINSTKTITVNGQAIPVTRLESDENGNSYYFVTAKSLGLPDNSHTKTTKSVGFKRLRDGFKFQTTTPSADLGLYFDRLPKSSETVNKFTTRTLLGKVDGENIYLSPPSWDCGWYWGFGYLGNRNCHYHVDGLKYVDGKRVDLHTGFKAHFGESLKVLDSDLWVLAELFSTFYTLKQSSEVLGRGGSHLTTNSLADLIKNTDEVTRINKVLMPAIFNAIHDTLNAWGPKLKAYKKIAKSVSKWDENTSDSTVNLIFDLGISMGDITDFNNRFGLISEEDRSLIHTKYYKRYHAESKASK